MKDFCATTSVEKVSLNSGINSLSKINAWCIEKFGQEIMKESQHTRNELHKFYNACEYLADNNVHLQFKQE